MLEAGKALQALQSQSMVQGQQNEVQEDQGLGFALMSSCRNTSLHNSRLGAEWLESCPEEKVDGLNRN